MSLHARIATLLVLAMLLVSPAAAQFDDVLDADREQQLARDLAELGKVRERVRTLQRESIEAFTEGDLDTAAEKLEAVLELRPGNALAMYNLACVRAMQGQEDAALEHLIAAIERGFVNYNHLSRDPSLSSIRETDTYRRIIESWPEIIEARGAAQVEDAKRRYGRRYLYEIDEDLRLGVAAAYDQTTLDTIKEELRLIADWATAEVFPELRERASPVPDPWVLMVLPNERHFKRWAIVAYGPDAILNQFHRVGGAYNHDQRELVSMDLGGTLRHEFMHVLHWRSNERAGVTHPIWVQEGLCSLVEDYVVENGRLVPTPSWRTNQLKRLEEAAGLMPIERLATLPRHRFVGERPLAHYAHARAIFLFLSQEGKLGAWYQHYQEHFASDPSGVESLEAVFGEEIEGVDRRFITWLRALPVVGEARTDGSTRHLTASLGLELDPGTGEGPIVLSVRQRDLRRVIRRRDVLYSIDGRPVRDMNDLTRTLGDLFPGQTVDVGLRRGREHLTVPVRLVEPR